jgi:hypothetical protein
MKMVRFWREVKGAVAAMTALVILVGLGMLALVIDLGHIFLVRSELQRAADAGAMAAALGLLSIPAGSKGPVSIVPDCPRALSAAQTMVSENQADGGLLLLLSGDVSFGKWDSAANTFTDTGCSIPKQVNAIKVRVRKDQSANEPITLFFARALPGGWRAQELSAEALALTGYAGYAPAGAFAFPLAIDAGNVDPSQPGKLVTIHLAPTPGDGGCWHSFDDKSAGTSDLRKLINGSTPSPEVSVGDQIKLKEGVSDADIKELGKVLADNKGPMDILLPVISGDSHTGWTTVLGFAAFHLTMVESSGSDKYLQGYTVPNYVAPGVSPGGPNYGLWAGVSKMVQ